jgi:hypothetical protein
VITRYFEIVVKRQESNRNECRYKALQLILAHGSRLSGTACHDRHR